MISVTETAAKRVQQQLARRGTGVGIRVGVRTTGCSGLAYCLEYVDTPSADLVKYTSNGVDVYVDPRDLPYVDGMVMEWRRQGLNEGFDFQNPKERDRCGCGESFRV